MKSSPFKEMKLTLSEQMFSKDHQDLHTFADACVQAAQQYLEENQGLSANAWRQACSALFANYAVQISKVNFDGKSEVGIKDEENEFIELINQGPIAINLGGWRINAGPKQNFVFAKDQFIMPGKMIRVYTYDKGDYCFKSDQPIWNNRGDQASLEDADGQLVSRWVYGRDVEPHIEISHLAFDGAEKVREGDEYVEIINTSAFWLDISHWILGGGHASDFVFPEGASIEPGGKIRVYTNKVDEATGGYSWDSKRAIWNNHTGRAHLTGFDQRLVCEYLY